MPDFIVDANLLFRVPCWNNERFVHVLKINPHWDDEIWAYAKAHRLIIISKNKDFLIKQIQEGPKSYTLNLVTFT